MARNLSARTRIAITSKKKADENKGERSPHAVNMVQDGLFSVFICNHIKVEPVIQQ